MLRFPTAPLTPAVAAAAAAALLLGLLMPAGEGNAQSQVASASAGMPAAVPAVAAGGDFRVAIDVGHTPAVPGARSARGVYEYEFNRRLGQMLLPALAAAGFPHSFLVNPEEREITLLDRARVAGERRADLFLALHHDSVQDSYLRPWVSPTTGAREFYCDRFRGYGIFCSARNAHADESRRFAGLLGDALLAAGLRPSPHHAERIPGESKVLLDRERGIYEYTNLVVLKWAAMPAALLECGVLVNREEEVELNQPERQQRTVAAIVRAVADFARTRPPPSENATAPEAAFVPAPGPVKASSPPRPAPSVAVGTPVPKPASLRPKVLPAATEPVAELPRSVVPSRTIPLPSPSPPRDR